MTPTEEWRPVVGYEGAYEVSDLGRVRSLDRKVWNGHVMRKSLGRVLSIHAGDRYSKVRLKNGDGGKTHNVHALVAAAFIGPRPDDLEVCHNNGEHHDNRAENLRYDTHRENALDVGRHGNNWAANKTHCKSGHEFTAENTATRANGGRTCRTCSREWHRVKEPKGRRRGADNPKAKLTEQAVRDLRADYGTGLGWAALGDRYGVTAQTARNVALRRNWKHIA